MEPIIFDLSKPIKYAGGSAGEIECSFIELREPTGKVSHLCCDIESLIQSGLMKMAGVLDDGIIAEATKAAEEAKESGKDTKDKDEGPDAESVLSIMSGGGVDMKRVVVSFRELFKHVAFMGSEKAITQPRMDDMTHKDFRQMMGVYASNFILS